MTHYTLGNEIKEKNIPETVSVAIVGAGMSGLYSAWRLLKEDTDPKVSNIAIFERSNRTGGRLDSDVVKFNNLNKSLDQPDTISVKEEQGGMRFLFEGMDDLMALFLKLNLQDQIVPFPMSSGGNNRLYFRGESFSVDEAAQNNHEIWSELYNLAPSEQGVNPKDIVNVVFNRILQENPTFKQRPKVRGPKFWQDFRLDCKWQGKALNKWTLWDLFSDMGYSQECISMLYRVLGFNGTFLSKMNAGVAYQLLEDFPANVKFKTFKEGFSTLPNALVNEVGTDKIHLQTTIEDIEYDDARAKYVLSYIHIDEKGDEHRSKVSADKVILALPKLALEKLFAKSNAFNKLPQEKSQQLWNTLQSTSNQPLLKINLYYDSAWWGNNSTGRPSVEFGPNFADLPTGSVYPFYAINSPLAAQLMYQETETIPTPEVEQKVDKISKEKYQKPAALTIYCDYLNINFWSALQHEGQAYKHPNQAHYISKENIPKDMSPATVAVVEQAKSFFQNIFNTHFIPMPILTSARIWEGSTSFDIPESQKFGYGVHQWAVGADDRKVIQDLAQPLTNLFTCGEAFSDYQGWVEGALRSADVALKEGFGLDPLSVIYEREKRVNPSTEISMIYDENASTMIREYIDKDYNPASTVPISSHSESSCIGVDLIYFDQE